MKSSNKVFLLLAIASFLVAGCGNTNISGDTSNTSSSDIESDSSLDTSSDTSSSTSSDPSSSPSTSASPSESNPNPENSKAIKTTVKALAQKKATDTKNLYRVTGIAQYAGYYKKGYFDLVDNGWTIVAYGVSSKNTCIKLSGTTYSYSQDDSFASTGIRAGDEITLEGIFTFYSYSSSYGVPEIQGYPTKIISNGLSVVTAKSYTASETYSGTYYNSITANDGGTSLGTKLHNLMMSTHSTYVSYSSLTTTLKSTDSKCFYTGQSYSSFNREHVWPQAKSKDGNNQLFGQSYAGADIHHIRASIDTYNSYRGSTMFAPIFGTPRTVNYTGGGVVKFGSGNNYGVTEPADSRKGDAARIIMYVYMHYGTDFGGTLTTGITGKLYITGVIGANSQADCFKLLRKWNAEDPVSSEEISRNETAFQIQGNRNPFIDYPSFADRIWN
ncbi:MAG: endonuclease [Bacilli bacterium]|nr:endonuclease [Bacilli bacterium]